MPGTVLGIDDTATNKKTPNSCSHGVYLLVVGKLSINKQVKYMVNQMAIGVKD